jgi:hypothetical protein
LTSTRFFVASLHSSTSGESPLNWQRFIESIGNEMPTFAAVVPENNLKPTPEQLFAEIQKLRERFDRLCEFLRKTYEG